MFLHSGMSTVRWCLVCTAGHAAADRDVQHHPLISVIPWAALTLTGIMHIFQTAAFRQKGCSCIRINVVYPICKQETALNHKRLR